MRARTVWLALGLLGCAPGSYSSYTSGSRLRAEVYDVDGVRLLHGWYDSALGAACKFDRTGSPDGSHPCLPLDTDDTGYFADAACTQRVHLRYLDGPVPRYLLQRPRDACSLPLAVYALGDATSLTTVYTHTADGCSPYPTGGEVVFPAGAQVPLDTFPLGHERVESRGGRLSSWVLATDDGAREVIGGWDEERREPSTMGDAGDQTKRWVPSHLAYAGSTLWPFFDDATCTRQVAAEYYGPGRACPITAVGPPPLRNAGAVVPTATVHEIRQDGVCSPLMAGEQEYLFLEIGDPVPATSLAPAAEVAGGAGRIQLRLAGSDGGPIAPLPDPAQLEDTARAQPCMPALASDGVLRCLPSLNRIDLSVGYADAACTVPAVNVNDPPPPVVLVTLSDGKRQAVRPVTNKIGAWYYRNNQLCIAAVNFNAYALGDELPPAQFEPVTDLRE